MGNPTWTHQRGVAEERQLGNDSDFNGVYEDGGVALTESGITFDGFVVANSADPAIGAGITMSPSEGNYLVTNNVVTDNTFGISKTVTDPVIFEKKRN